MDLSICPCFARETQPTAFGAEEQMIAQIMVPFARSQDALSPLLTASNFHRGRLQTHEVDTSIHILDTHERNYPEKQKHPPGLAKHTIRRASRLHSPLIIEKHSS
jgi:hypothetical protein